MVNIFLGKWLKRVKDLASLLLWLWLHCGLRCGLVSIPGPGNFHMPLVWPLKKEKEKEKKLEELERE